LPGCCSRTGADVILVDRPDEPNLGYPAHPYRFLYRNRRSVRADLKTADGVEAVLRLVEHADALIEGFRPGVAERMGLGPDACLARNPKLVYGRMTGYGQTGPVANRAGFDINYLSLTEWVALFDGDDDCVQPVLDLLEAPSHPHHAARGAFVEVDGTTQPSPAPRFSRTPSVVTRRSPYPGEGGLDALKEWGLSDVDITRFQ
jgi:crotonobetainyl-CoA:carnitine CoA-transferase CaiB-like acyl-CoA transferase